MRTSQYSEEQIIGFSRQAEAGVPIKEIGRRYGFSDASFYKWRSRFGVMDATEAIRLLAEAHLDSHALKSVFGTKRWPHKSNARRLGAWSLNTKCLNATPAPLWG